jgi:hypothetical protein
MYRKTITNLNINVSMRLNIHQTTNQTRNSLSMRRQLKPVTKWLISHITTMHKIRIISTMYKCNIEANPLVDQLNNVVDL